MRTRPALLGALAVAFLPAWVTCARSQNPTILIFGGNDHREFLGCLNCSEFDGDSVANQFSTYGWSNQFGKWSEFGQFKSKFSGYSACNEFATDPPVLVDRAGDFYGRLTVSQFTANSICGLTGNQEVCTALKVMCVGP